LVVARHLHQVEAPRELLQACLQAKKLHQRLAVEHHLPPVLILKYLLQSLLQVAKLQRCQHK
jgi:hypothetical protein